MTTKDTAQKCRVKMSCPVSCSLLSSVVSPSCCVGRRSNTTESGLSRVRILLCQWGTRGRSRNLFTRVAPA